jgi:hypothetical protein
LPMGPASARQRHIRECEWLGENSNQFLLPDRWRSQEPICGRAKIAASRQCCQLASRTWEPVLRVAESMVQQE